MNFRGKDTYSTTRGGIITLIVYVIVLTLSLELIKRLYNKSEPTILTYDTFTSAPDVANLNTSR